MKLGDFLRSAFLGYHWCEKYRLYIRITGEVNVFRIDVCPKVCIYEHLKGNAHKLVKGLREIYDDTPHIAWWENGGEEFVLASLDHLLKKEFPAPTSFLIDEEGKPVASGKWYTED